MKEVKRKKSRIENRSSKKKKGKSSKKRNLFGFFFGLLLKVIFIFIIIFSSCFGYYYFKNDMNFSKAFEETLNKILFKQEQITVLVLGVSTDIKTELADTIMVCSYNPKKQYAYVLSIPRDTFVGSNKNKAKGRDKINSLYSKDGVDGILEKVEEITGLDIDYYAVVRNNALIDIVDSIGGVYYQVPIDMNYDDPTQNLHIHLNKGLQLIDGEKAEHLLRFRHNNDGSSYPSSYGDNDFGRMRTQREFLKETAKQVLKIGNVGKLRKITKAVMNNLDTNLDFKKVVRYIPSALGYNIDSLETVQLPGESQKCNSLWVYIYNKEETRKLIEGLNSKIGDK